MTDLNDVRTESSLHWEASLEVLKDASARRAWLFAGFAFTVALLAMFAVIVMLPLKRVVPYVIAVDKATGQSEVVSLAASQPVRQQTIEAKYWLAQYVRARERLDRELLASDFETVERLSGSGEAHIYRETVKAILEEDHKGRPRPSLRVEILSIGLVDEHQAVVRFERIPIGAPGSPPQPSNRATATLTFSIKPVLIGRERDLIENPIGFQVQSYRVDQDLLELDPRP